MSAVWQNNIKYILFYQEETKMAVKVAINGFGRIGSLEFRKMFGA